MKVILVSTYIYEGNFRPNFKPTRNYEPPLGLGYIASYLNMRGHICKIIDGQVNNYSPELLINKILNENPDVVGLTGYTRNRFSVLRLVDLLKKTNPNLVIVLGGPHFGQTGEELLKNKKTVDYVIKGEGERSLYFLLDYLQNKKCVQEVEGLFYRKNDSVMSNPIKRLTYDQIPDIDWSLFELEKYSVSTRGVPFKGKVISIGSSRGCPSQCIFCSNQACWGSKLILMPPKKIVDQIEYLNKKYGYTFFNFIDDTFTLSKKHVDEFCNELISRKINITWAALARIHTVDLYLLKKMRTSGCVKVAYGIESGSENILKTLKKGIKLEDAIETIRISAELDFYVIAFFMYSHPGETLKDFKKTIKLAKEIKSLSNKVSVTLSLSKIFPGTELELIAKKEGLIKKSFSWNSPYYNKFNKYLFLEPTYVYYYNKDLPYWKITIYKWIHYYRFIDLIKEYWLNKRRQVSKLKKCNRNFTTIK